MKVNITLDINLSWHIISSSASPVPPFINLCVGVEAIWDLWFQIMWIDFAGREGCGGVPHWVTQTRA